MKRWLILGVLLLLPFSRARAVWDTTTPSGSESKSLGDDRIRELKTDVQTSLQYEGSFPGSDTSNPRFIYKLSSGTTGSEPTGNAAPAGRLFFNDTRHALEQSSGDGVWRVLDPVSTGSVTASKLGSDVAGNGLAGGNGAALTVNADTTTFTFNGSTLAVRSDSIGTAQLADAVSFPTSVNSSTYTWKNLGVLPILQIQIYHTETSSNTVATSFVNTTLSGSFTPRSSNSSVYIWVQGVASQNVGDGGYFTIARDGSTLAPNTGGFMGTVAGNNYDVVLLAHDSGYTGGTAVTYAVRFRTAGGGGSIVFPVSLGGVVPSAQMWVVEIGQ